MQNRLEQLSLSLSAENPFSNYYFVPHSGVQPALSLLRSGLEQLRKNPQAFFFYTLAGPSGVGKSHLLSAFMEEASNQGIERLVGLDFSSWPVEKSFSDAHIASFIHDYERLKTSGGMLLVAEPAAEVLAQWSPHVTSRFGFAVSVPLSYPTEDELRPLAISLLERRNLRISPAQLEYVLRRVPANPLSLANIFARIDELSLRSGKSAGREIVKEVLIREGSTDAASQ